MIRYILYTAVVLTATACSQTPAQEAGGFLGAISACIEQNRDAVIETFREGAEGDAYERYEGMCGIDRESLSPEALARVEESGAAVLREAGPAIMRAAFATAGNPFSGEADEEQARTAQDEAVDALIAAFATAAAEIESR